MTAQNEKAEREGLATVTPLSVRVPNFKRCCKRCYSSFTDEQCPLSMTVIFVKQGFTLTNYFCESQLKE